MAEYVIYCAEITDMTNQKALRSSTNLGEISQHFRHFISTFSAADIDNDVTVRVLGQRLRDHRLSTSKGAWYSSGAALHATIQQGGHVV